MDRCEKFNLETLDHRAKLDVMLHEYEATQASAQHYNSLLWQVISIFTAANAVLLAAVGNAVFGVSGHWLRWGFVAGMAALGLVTNLASLRFTYVFRSYQSQKLERCRELEESICYQSRPMMSNHTRIFSHEGLQKGWYYVLEGTLLVIWALLLITSLCRLRCCG